MGSNAQQALSIIDQGVGLFQDIHQMSSSRDSAASRGNAEADLLETDAKANAYESQRQAKKEASKLRNDRERKRARQQADWGGANLSMSGSKALIRDANTIQDLQDEDDVLFEGQRESNAILRQARNRANALRINSGASANRSILSMGSKIYGPRS